MSNKRDFDWGTGYCGPRTYLRGESASGVADHGRAQVELYRWNFPIISTRPD